jgi:sensor histidine kinase YesM
LLRTSFRESSYMLKPISDELDFVRNYCELQKLRFGERFNYSIDIGEGVDINKEIPR